jgi:hypothetical protein
MSQRIATKHVVPFNSVWGVVPIAGESDSDARPDPLRLTFFSLAARAPSELSKLGGPRLTVLS